MPEARPLAAKRVVVTRAAAQGAALMEKLRAAGAIPFAAPAIRILPPDDPSPLHDALGDLTAFDWLVCTSANAVSAFTKVRESRAHAWLSGLHVAAIGPATSRALEEAGITVHFQPSTALAEALGRELPIAGGTRVLWPRGDLAAMDLADALTARGARVTAPIAYRSVADIGLLGIVDALRNRRIDAITFTSPSTVRHVVEGLATAGVQLDQFVDGTRPLIVCIGPVTAAAARACGLSVDGIADPSDDDGLVTALIRCFTGRPTERPRRTRRTAALREFVRETRLHVEDLIHPLFVVEGSGIEKPIETMPGHAQLSVDKLGKELTELRTLGVRAVLLFGIPKSKDDIGSGAWDADGPVPCAVAEIKRLAPDLLVICDVCLCEYTAHGHCGVVRDASGVVDNDETLPLLGQAAVCYAQAGADIVAPSAMMDGQVATIRAALDDAGLPDTPILSYAAKHASAFYGPFRAAAESAPSFGDRRSYQMDPANAREALREVRLDVDEGADLLMVKPAGTALDIIHQVRAHFPHTLVAYQVSGEYAMLKAAAERGWLDEPRAALESLLAIRRAGADRIITYYAKEAARWLSTAG